MTWICARCRTRFPGKRARCPHDGKRVVEDLTGVTLADRYELRELVGVGGMDGSVWVGWQTSTHRTVAVKLLPPAGDAGAERFARGARIASNLNHPHITIVHDYGRTEDGKLFLVMELLEGHTLHRVLKQTGALGVERALHIADQTLRALEHAHARHVVHRDLKPGNLFLTQKNDDPDFVKVLDFGIAKYVAEDPEAEALAAALQHEVTEERQICGTPHYMAPEQVMMGRIDGRTDLYALGVVTYRMLTGRLPFESRKHHELFQMHLNAEPPPMAEVRPDLEIPPAVEQLVRTALAKSPEDRFASAAEMRRALRQVRRSLGIFSGDDDSLNITQASWPSAPPSVAGATPPPAPAPAGGEPRAGRGRRVAIVGAVAAGVAAGVFVALRPDERPRPSPAVAARDAGAPSLVGVHLTSDPPGAQVLHDGQRLGETPVRAALPPGAHTFTFALDGHLPETIRVDLDPADAPAGVTRAVRLTPVRAPDAAVAAEPPRPAPPSRPPAPRGGARRPDEGASRGVAARVAPPSPAPRRSERSARERPRSAPAPTAPASVEANGPAGPAPDAPPTSRVRVRLLDEDETRAFPVAAPASAPAAGARGGPADAPRIPLLDDPGAAPPPRPTPGEPPPEVDIELLDD